MQRQYEVLKTKPADQAKHSFMFRKFHFNASCVNPHIAASWQSGVWYSGLRARVRSRSRVMPTRQSALKLRQRRAARTSTLRASTHRHRSATTMTPNQACRPCARRKVRCDRLDPCSNCKRRKIDRCTYPASTPSDRIRQLEDLVQELSHSPNKHSTSLGVAQIGLEHNDDASSAEMRSNDPMMLKENGTMQYLES
jgi:hypothetical protein